MIEFQRLLLGDTLRNKAFSKALKAVIVPGKTVMADIGSGTGYLSFLAEKMGAKECHLYEFTELLPLSERLGKENGMKRCRYHHTHSTDVTNPPACDLVVSETLGNYALEENIIETLNDARRFLKESGTVMPESLRQFVAPVTSPRLYDELNVWDNVEGNIRLAAAKNLCMNNMYVKEITSRDLMPGKDSVLQWDSVDFGRKNQSVREKSVEWSPVKDMTLYGFALWWEATLTKAVTISTSPLEALTHWKQIYLPVLNPQPVKKGQTLRLHLKSDTRYEVKINLEWTATVKDARGKVIKEMKQDMMKGYVA